MRIFMLFMLFSNVIYPWAKTGHRITAEIAQRHLTPKAAAAIKQLLPPGKLARMSNWADLMRSNPNFRCAGPLHYVSMTSKQAYLEGSPNTRGDLISALIELEEILRNEKADLALRQTALRYYVHLVGDIHQPLHVGLKCDRGGNRVKVYYHGKMRKLHVVWDYELIESQKLSYTEFATMLLEHAGHDQLAEYRNSNYFDWAAEATKLRPGVYRCYKEDRCRHRSFEAQACNTAELNKMFIPLKYQYEYHNVPVVERQLLKGGIRLAEKLNQIFSGKALNTEKSKLRKQLKIQGEPAKQCLREAVKMNHKGR